MTNLTRSFSQSLTILAFLGASFAVGCSSGADTGGEPGGDGDLVEMGDGDGDSGTTTGDGDGAGAASGDGDSAGATFGDGDGAGAMSGDGDQPGDGDGDQPGDGDGDQPGDGDGDLPGDGDGDLGGDGDAPVGPCELGDFTFTECGVCACDETGEWQCEDVPGFCPAPCEGDNCCGGQAYPEFEVCQSNSGWQCVGEQWMCNPESECPSVASNGRICLEVVVGAQNPETETCCQFGSPCNVPAGWLSCGDEPVIEPPVIDRPVQPAN